MKDISKELNWLYNQKKQKKREDLSRIKKCIEMLDIKTNYPIFHISGTNGKGSTASFIKNILIEAKYKVGFFVSPFVVCFNERIQINNDYIPNERIAEYITKLKQFSIVYSEQYSDTIPFFELTFLMALLYFEDMNIDVAVIECGLGGRLDATNCLDTSIQIITNIGYDHMQSLGNTLEEIAYHKLGITRPGKKCFTCVDNNLKPYFNNYAKDNDCQIVYINDDVSSVYVDDYTYFLYKDNKYSCNLLGDFQAYNASLAIAAMREFNPNINDETISNGLKKVFWPGRLEIINRKPLIIIDGGHNIHGINALVDSIKKYYSNYNIKTIFTALHDKAYPEMISLLDEITSMFYFTTINDIRATEKEEFLKYSKKPAKIIDFDLVFKTAISELKENDLLLVTGSLHFISNAREMILNLIEKGK